jgi:hypothetical protein
MSPFLLDHHLFMPVALKGTSEQIKQHFLQCMSERGAEMILEDMEAMGPIKIKEVEAAQQEIIAIVRKLEAERGDKPAWNSRRAVCCLGRLGEAAGARGRPVVWQAALLVRQPGSGRHLFDGKPASPYTVCM